MNRKKHGWLALLGAVFGGCTMFAGIEEGTLGLCPDGAPLTEEGCERARGGSSGGDCRDCAGRCPVPWEYEDHATGQCYLIETREIEWPAARQRCLDLGGDLAAIGSVEELAFVGGIMTSSLWIGGTDKDNEGVFRWSNGEPWVFSSWLDGTPQGSHRDCVALTVLPGSLPVFDARGCGEERGYLCESMANGP